MSGTLVGRASVIPAELVLRAGGGRESTCQAGPRELGLALPNTAERELFFYEGSANVYENKRGRSERGNDAGMSLEKSELSVLVGIYLKTSQLAIRQQVEFRPARQKVMAWPRPVLSGLSAVRRYRRRSATMVT